jgi:hypothetical protein
MKRPCVSVLPFQQGEEPEKNFMNKYNENSNIADE